ncbi:amino acid ABC transporter ATP-binding protein [Anaeroarcus burkinensis]|uniref:amino acid ABC transporter ATP-binding protein n=1 Tax=Anaeroarcus burkinensis TaxID=82376 RepID=UPI000408044A|nr:amino acid ABC transporter ATP-binding protein [Anaeroarcus burkinensis]
MENTKHQPLLKIENLYKKYDETTVLKDIQLTVHTGEVIVILGPSGCGKSTLLRCLNGLEIIHGGQIILSGDVLTPASDWQKIRQRVGMVFQSYELFPHMTVLDNILLGPVIVQKRPKKEATEQALSLLERIGLLEKKEAFPRQLSGGQKQRIAIVRALCMNPDIMLFDEVTAALDPEMVREVLDVILTLAQQGMTMLIVTHEMNFAQAVADRVVFMEHGQICEIAEPDSFFKHPSTLRAQQFLNTFQFKKGENE